jgi:hypothetical protein
MVFGHAFAVLGQQTQQDSPQMEATSLTQMLSHFVTQQ